MLLVATDSQLGISGCLGDLEAANDSSRSPKPNQTTPTNRTEPGHKMELSRRDQQTKREQTTTRQDQTKLTEKRTVEMTEFDSCLG